MIFSGGRSLGGRGLRGLGRRNLRGLRIHGYGAYMGFGDTPYYLALPGTPSEPAPADEYSYNPGYSTDSTSSVDYGTLASGIGTGIGNLFTGIGNLFAGTRPNPSTNPYGQTGQAGQPASSSNTAMLIGAGVVGLGVLLVVMKK